MRSFKILAESGVVVQNNGKQSP